MRLVMVLCVFVKLSWGQDFGDQQCGGIFTKKQFSIESPDYPENYQANQKCEYVLKGPSCPAYYNFQFLDFELEDSFECIKDRLEIGQEEILCGRRVGIKDYFAENGTLRVKFISNQYKPGKGFKILITRQPCLSNVTQLSLKSQNSTINCCKDVYDRSSFMITNPGFPNSRSSSFDCEYKIRRANNNICRLRLIFRFYRHGLQESDGCSNGYLEIDNKRICGCRSGLKLTSNFDQTWKNKLKIIKYINNGYSNGVNGFAIEIFQDECPKKHESYWNKMFPYYNSYHHYFKPHFNLDFFGFSQAREIEETSYEDISNYDPFVLKASNDHKCAELATAMIYKTWFRNIPKCSVNPNDNRCIILSSTWGSFESFGYPYWYQNNLNQCYRFLQQPGYCAVRVQMLDFDLQYSFCCYRDYFLFENNYKYCGNDLCNTFFTLAFDKPYIDINFITDKSVCGRGFSAIYEQQLCYNNTPTIPTTTESSTEVTEITIEVTTQGVSETTTETPTIETTTELLHPTCGGVIMEEIFNLEVFGSQDSTCRFIVRRLNDSVCTLNIYFEDFDLDCNRHHLLINDRKYCGRYTGNTIYLEFANPEMELRYSRNTFLGAQRMFSIRLEQDYVNCSPDLEPPPS